jgi:hypothetical protein
VALVDVGAGPAHVGAGEAHELVGSEASKTATLRYQWLRVCLVKRIAPGPEASARDLEAAGCDRRRCTRQGDALGLLPVSVSQVRR